MYTCNLLLRRLFLNATNVFYGWKSFDIVAYFLELKKYRPLKNTFYWSIWVLIDKLLFCKFNSFLTYFSNRWRNTKNKKQKIRTQAMNFRRRAYFDKYFVVVISSTQTFSFVLVLYVLENKKSRKFTWCIIFFYMI